MGQDEEGHFLYTVGQNLTPRYKIMKSFGEGTFGKVVQCWDRQTQSYCAVKVVRSVPKYSDAAKIEIDILEDLRRHGTDLQSCVVHLIDHFEFEGHVCMVFEELGPSLYDWLRKNHYRGFTLPLVRDFARQILNTLALLEERCELVHTDLKPENILLVGREFFEEPQQYAAPMRYPKDPTIKMIDFGSATYEHQHHTSIICTRHYRPPEVILECTVRWVRVRVCVHECRVSDINQTPPFIKSPACLGWSFPADIWSVGCILTELFTGDALFQTHENLEHLALFEKVLGPLPKDMIQRCGRHHSEKYFREGRLAWPEMASGKDSLKAVTRQPRLEELISPTTPLYDLVRGLLAYDPSQRLTARQALHHPFFSADLVGNLLCEHCHHWLLLHHHNLSRPGNATHSAAPAGSCRQPALVALEKFHHLLGGQFGQLPVHPTAAIHAGNALFPSAVPVPVGPSPSPGCDIVRAATGITPHVLPSPHHPHPYPSYRADSYERRDGSYERPPTRTPSRGSIPHELAPPPRVWSRHGIPAVDQQHGSPDKHRPPSPRDAEALHRPRGRSPGQFDEEQPHRARYESPQKHGNPELPEWEDRWRPDIPPELDEIEPPPPDHRNQEEADEADFVPVCVPDPHPLATLPSSDFLITPAK
ncbi:putative Serine/threonine-protein kinase AFC2 [Paratrimastix pyriformis]|uniref:Serine/threonine-protein kinase AFC2 n=1 Tax=Paratrimastix pyriformis TaxID=342808 RepID=A0ABQ8UW12_9EUKA|nr:putative Serine/threonine-protein kinase AFC2 [Paratrimastix pyriformis]